MQKIKNRLLAVYFNHHEGISSAQRIVVFFLLAVLLISLFGGMIALLQLTYEQLTLINKKQEAASSLTGLSTKIFSYINDAETVITNSEHSTRIGILLTGIGAIVTAIFPIATTISMYRLRRELKENSTIRSTRIFDKGVDDVRVMIEEYKNSDHVILFGGSFDWLARNQQGFETIKSLIQDNKLTLVSYRPTEEISERLNKINPSIFPEIKGSLLQDLSIKSLRASLIYKGKRLNRYLYLTDDITKGTFVHRLMADRTESVQLLEQIEILAYKYRRPRQDRSVVFVCGNSESGKTTFCKYLEDRHAYHRISVSDEMRKILENFHKQKNYTDLDLANFGIKIINQDEEPVSKLHLQISSKIRQYPKVVVDGLRSPTIFSRLINEHSHARLLFLEPDPAIPSVVKDQILVDTQKIIDQELTHFPSIARFHYKGIAARDNYDQLYFNYIQKDST